MNTNLSKWDCFFGGWGRLTIIFITPLVVAFISGLISGGSAVYACYVSLVSGAFWALFLLDAFAWGWRQELQSGYCWEW